MKALILAAAMSVAATAHAWTADYGPGAYTKKAYVCYKGTNQQCQWNLYKYYAPRMETVQETNNSGNVIKTYNRLTTGNYGSIIFDNAEEARLWEKGGSKDNGNKGDNCRGGKR